MKNSTGLPLVLGSKMYLLAAAAMLAFAGMSAQSFAAEPGTASGAKAVSLRDLDLSTVEGQRVAHERLHTAVTQLCSRLEDEKDLSSHATYLACTDTANAKADAQLQAMVNRIDTNSLARN